MCGSGFGRRPGWDAFLAAMRPPGGRGGHRGGVEGDDVPAVADHHPEPVGGQPVPGHDDPAGGGDVAELAADGMADHHAARRPAPAAPSSGCRGRTPTPAVTRCAASETITGYGTAGTGAQRFGLGDGGDRGPPVGGGPQAGVAPHPGEAVHTGLGLLDGQLRRPGCATSVARQCD